MRHFQATPMHSIRDEAVQPASTWMHCVLPVQCNLTQRRTSHYVSRTTLAGTMSACRIGIALHARANS